MNLLFYSRHSDYTAASVGGAETSIRLTAEMMSRRGHAVHYLTSSPETTRLVTERRDEGVAVTLYPPFRRSIARQAKRALLGKKVKRTWFEGILRQVVTRNRIDLVYAHYDTGFLKAILGVRQAADPKVVMRMAGLKWYEEIKSRPRLKPEYESIFGTVDSVNYISSGLRELCHQHAREVGLELAPRDEFVADIGTRVDPDTGESDLGADANALKVVVVMRFSRYQKRQDILIEAVRLLGDRIPLRALMVGDGPRRGEAQKTVRDHRLGGTIEIRPFTHQKQLWQEMRRADLLCHPCEYEGLGKVVVEAMTMGLPVMVSDVVPLNQYIDDNVTGYLVPNTPAEWAARLEAVFADRRLNADVGKAARTDALERFDPERNARVYEEQFLRLLARTYG